MEPPATSTDDMSDSDDHVVTSCLPIGHSSPPPPSGDGTLPSTTVKSIGTAFMPHHRKTHSLAPE